MAAGLTTLVVSGITMSILLTAFLPLLCRLFGATDDIMPARCPVCWLVSCPLFSLCVNGERWSKVKQIEGGNITDCLEVLRDTFASVFYFYSKKRNIII